MRSFDELEALWQRAPQSPRRLGTIRLIVVRTAAGVHETPRSARLDPDLGLVGDRWARAAQPDRDCQLTLMDVRVVELLGAAGQPLDAAGDNVLVDLDLGVAALPAGSRVQLGGALAELSAAPHTGCRKFAERYGQDALRWVNWHPFRERRLRGVNCRVVTAGTIRVGDIVEILPPPPHVGDLRNRPL